MMQQRSALQLAAVTLYSADSYALQLDAWVSVGHLARYLAAYRGIGEEMTTPTLEWARPALSRHRLQEIDLQDGDRLLILTRAPRQGDIPAGLGVHDKRLTFTAGAYKITSQGKRHFLLGKTDLTRGITPDVEARSFIPPHNLDYFSRECVRFDYDPVTRAWYALKVGVTRLMLDDYELGGDPVPIPFNSLLTFYRGGDDPRRTGSQPLGSIHLHVDDPAPSSLNIAEMPQTGDFPLRVVLGAEKADQRIGAGLPLTFEMIAEYLAEYNREPLPTDFQVYTLRLLSPKTALNSIKPREDEFFYLGTRAALARNLIALRDAQQRDRVYVLQAGAGGAGDDDKLIGRRATPESYDAAVNLDLLDYVRAVSMAASANPDTLDGGSRYYAWLHCSAADNTWWIRLAAVGVSVYVNNRRLMGNDSVPLSAGDVITFVSGTQGNADSYFARFEVEMAAHHFDPLQHTMVY